MGKIILCDMDSVIADFYQGCLDAYLAEENALRREAGLEPTGVAQDVLKTWDAKFPNGKDCYAYFSQPGFFRNLAPVRRSQEVLKEWHDRGHQVVILSAATLTNAPGEKFEWLTEHFPWIHRDNVVFTKRKELVRGDLFIDDHASNAKAYRKANPNTPIIGIRYPYNLEETAEFTYVADDYTDLDAAWEEIRVYGNYLLSRDRLGL